jgi:hypothetical protein
MVFSFARSPHEAQRNAGLGNASIAIGSWFRFRPGLPAGAQLQHDPEKWVPVFGKDHAHTTS